MKSIDCLLCILLTSLSFNAYSQSNNTFKITGNIAGVPDGGIILLNKVEGSVGITFMRDTIYNGTFLLEGVVDSLEEVSLIAFGEKYPMKSIKIWIAPGSQTKISGKGHYLSTWDVDGNLKEQQEEELYRNVLKESGAESDSLFVLYYYNISKGRNTVDESEKQAFRSEGQRLNKEFQSLSFIEHRKIFEIMLSQPITESWISRLAVYAQSASTSSRISNYPEENWSQLQNLYNKMSDKQKQSRKGKLIYRYIFPFEVIKPGDKMASAELFDPEGIPHKIAEEYKGKYILIDFWSIGCRPCIEAFPEMKELYKEKEERLTIVSITVDTYEIWEEGLKKHQLPWVNLTDHLGMEGYPSFYGVYGIPFYVLISPDGIVQEMWSGYGKGSLKEKLKDI